MHKRGATLLASGKAIATAKFIVYVRQESCILCSFGDTTFLEDVGEHIDICRFIYCYIIGSHEGQPGCKLLLC